MLTDRTLTAEAGRIHPTKRDYSRGTNFLAARRTHWKPGEYERNADLLKKAIESLKKDERQHQTGKRINIVSTRDKRKPRKKNASLNEPIRKVHR